MKHLVRLAWALVAAAGSAVAQTGAEAPPEPAPATSPVREGAQAPDTPAGRQLRWLLDAMGSDGAVDLAARCSPAFLAAVPAESLGAVFEQLRAGTGGLDLVGVREASPVELVASTRARRDGSRWRVVVGVEPAEPHRFEALLLQPEPEPEPALGSWAELDERLGALAPMASVFVGRVSGDGAWSTVHEREADASLAVGSTFKLYVLGALAEWIEAGGEGAPTWEEALAIREEWKSLPSGVMQNIPAGETRPVRAFALGMISISDNTATDHLLHRVGRERVEGWFAARVKESARSLPFLTTREVFALKLSMDPGLSRRWVEADEAGRRAMLEPGGAVATAKPSLALGSAWTKPIEIERIEWFVSTRELARVLAELEGWSRRPGLEPLVEILTSNPGVPLGAGAWSSAAYKGGSEPGVLNLTWVLTPARALEDGSRFAVSITANDPGSALAQERVVGLGQRAIELLAREALQE